MLQSINWQATDALTRLQFAVFHEASNDARLTEAERRTALRLSEQDWEAWSDFLRDGPLPAYPVLPEMLCRLASVSHGLAMQAERIGIAA